MDIPSLFFERHPNPMFIFDVESLEILDVNKRAENKYGFTREEFKELTIEEIRPSEDIPRLQTHLKKLGEKNFQGETIFRHLTKDGQILFVQVTSQFYPYQDRRTRIVHIHDLTQTIQLKQKVEQSYLEHQQHIDHNPLAMVKCDHQFRIIEWSKRAEEKTGYSKEEIIGSSTFDLDIIEGGGEVGKIKERFEKLASGEIDKDRFETTILLKNGRSMEVRLHVSALRDREGQLKTILAFIENISKRKQYERKLKQREHKYHQLLEESREAREELRRREKLFESLFLNSPIAIAMMDNEGRVKKLNNSYEELFGYNEEELAGKSLLKYQLPEDRHDEIKQRYQKAFANKHATAYYEDERITKEGKVKDLLIGSLPVVIDGEHIALFGIYTDITQLKKTEEHLQNSLQEKEVLLAEIHHRVKNNLAIISGLLELESMNWEEDSAVHKVLRQSQLRVHSMASIHEQLYKFKDFSTLKLEDYLSELVGTIFTSMQGRQKGIKTDINSDNITLNINQAVPCALIINELVTNAMKYAFEGGQEGTLEVKARQEGDDISLVVGDNGLGLPQDFKQMVKHSLGHQLVSQLVKQLDGEIEVESTPGEGTNYSITFRKTQKSGSASRYFM